MNYYLAGTSVSLPINFVDDDGNPLEVTHEATVLSIKTV